MTAAVMKAANANNVEYCAVESDHLHNLPSLLDETNRYRHEFYCLKERVSYLKWLLNSRDQIRILFVADWYVRHWRQIDTILEIKQLVCLYDDILRIADSYTSSK